MQKYPNMPSRLSSEERASLRYRYQGQAGFDASKTMSPSRKTRQVDSSETFASGEPLTAADKLKKAEKSAAMVHSFSDALESFKPKREERSFWSKAASITALILFTIVLVIGSLGSSLAFVAFTPTNAALIAYAHADFSPEEIEARQIIAAEILHYVVTLPFESTPDIEISQEDLDTLRQWSLGEYELCHLRDVRILLGNSLLLSFVITVGSVIVITLIRNTQFARHSLLAAGIACLVIPTILGFFLLFFFQPTFVLFHEIFFPQGNWQFAPETLLISTLPERYWQAAGVLWMSLFMINGLILTALSRFCGKMRAENVTND